MASAATRCSSSAANAATMWSTSAVERYICSMNDVTVFSSEAFQANRWPVADSTCWRRHGDGSAAYSTIRPFSSAIGITLCVRATSSGNRVTISSSSCTSETSATGTWQTAPTAWDSSLRPTP